MTDEPGAVVYDLDGTLVSLAVDWGTVASDLRALLVDAGHEATSESVWPLLDTAADVGLAEAAESLVAEHERRGAADSTRLPTAAELPDATVPVGVCSLNAESACRIALDVHDLAGHVDVVVGRDSHPSHKPDPGPLLAVADDLGVEPAAVLFVGDTERDAETARRAGTRFRYV